MSKNKSRFRKDGTCRYGCHWCRECDLDYKDQAMIDNCKKLKVMFSRIVRNWDEISEGPCCEENIEGEDGYCDFHGLVHEFKEALQKQILMSKNNIKRRELDD